MLKKISKVILLLGVLGYVGFCSAVYFFPQLFFYNPSSEKPDLAKAVSAGFPAQEVTYHSADGTELYGWYVKPSSKNKVIVYFHGNSYDIGAFYHKLIPFVKEGYGVFIGEYRGFGGIKGLINEKNLGADAVAAVNYLHEQGWANKDIILYGMSLGSYTSTYTAHTLGQQNPFAGLILEVPFDSVFNVVKQRFWPVFPFSLIVQDHYENTDRISEIKTPILIMAAENDKIVPVQRAEALDKAIVSKYPSVLVDRYKGMSSSLLEEFCCMERDVDNKVMIVYKGEDVTHSNLYDFDNWNDILSWLNCHENWLEKNEKTE